MERKFSKTILKIATVLIVLMLCVLLILGIGKLKKQDKYQVAYEHYDGNNIVISELYTVENGYLSRILPETTLRDLKNNLDNQQISVHKKDGSELQDTELVGTGMSLKIGNEEYTLSVIGDINGNGKIGITDVTQMKLSLIGKKAKPQNEYAKAADINNSGSLTITDVTRENLALIGIVDLIAPNTFVPEVVSTKDTITVLGETSDTNSGIKEYWFEINNNGWVSNTDKSNNKYTFTGLNMETEYTIRMKVVDNAGNTKITKRVTIETLNEENANISIVASTTEWTNKNILVAVNFNSNVAKETKQISIDNGNSWVEYTEPITVDKNMKIKARVVNSSGKVLEEQEKEITNIDKLAPNEFEISATSTTDSITINIGTEQNLGTTDAQATGEYACSGIKEYKYTIIDGHWEWEETTTDASYTFGDLAQGKKYKIIVTAIDNAGNEISNETLSTDETAIQTEKDIEYKITYDTNGGNLSDSDTIVTVDSKSSVTLPVATKTGYEFEGWYSDSELTTKVGNAGDEYIPTADITLYAKWEIDNIEYYGKEVTNYTCSSSGVNTWRVFHIDDDNIYLISDDYVAYDNLPTDTAGTALTQGDTDYKAYWNDTVLSDYTGSEWIRENTNPEALKWISYVNESNYPSSTNNNIKAVAYMMDTDKWGEKFVGNMAEYAIGGPTIELFCASYKVTHPDKYVECTVASETGYQVKWSSDTSYDNSIIGATRDDFNSIYIKGSTTNASGMWLASPNASFSDCVMYAYYFGSVSGSNSTPVFGFRPIVCLKSGTELVKNADGETYSLRLFNVTGNPTEWTNEDVTLTITAFDESGISSITVNGKSQTLTDGQCEYTVTENGEYEIIVTNGNGDTTTKTITVDKIDKTAPKITFSKESNSTELATQEVGVTLEEEESGISVCKYVWLTSETSPTEEEKYTGGELTASDTISKKALSGDYYLHVYAKDNAGNVTITRTEGTFKFRYEIWTEEDLIYFVNEDVGVDNTLASLVTMKGKTVYIMDDIEVSPDTVLEAGRFDGTIEGNGHTISGIVDNSNLEGGYIGGSLIASLERDGIIRNLGIINLTSTVISNNLNDSSTGNYYGGIVGQNWGTIENCYVIGDITVNNSYKQGLELGGLVGCNCGSGTIKNSYFQGNIEITDNIGSSSDYGYGSSIGGIAGANFNSIQGCYLNGTIDATCLNDSKTYVGGIVGVTQGGNIEQCYTTADSEIISDFYAGGLIGETKPGSTVESCYNLATVKGKTVAGGISARICSEIRLPSTSNSGGYEDAVIQNCYNRGIVISETLEAGGIVGNCNAAGKINYCYNTGDVKGPYAVGGIVGFVLTPSGDYGDSEINNTYNCGRIYATSANAITGGICGVLQSKVSMYNSYNDGNIGQGKYYGGIIGEYYDGLAISNCKYKQGTSDSGIGVKIDSYNQEVTNVDIAGGAEVASSSSMPSVLDVVNGSLEFTRDKTPNINDGYPILRWQ